MPSVYKRINQGYVDYDKEAQKDIVRKQFRFVAQANERNLEPTLLDNITKFNIDKYFDDFRDEVQRVINSYLSKEKSDDVSSVGSTLSIILSYNLLTNYIKNYVKMNKIDQKEKSDIQDKFESIKPLVQQVINIAAKSKSKNLSQLLEIYDNIDSFHYVPVNVDAETQKEYEDKIQQFEAKQRGIISIDDMKKQVKVLYDDFFVKDEEGNTEYETLNKTGKKTLDNAYKKFNILYKKYKTASERLKPQIFEEMQDIYQRFIYESSGAVAQLPEEISPELEAELEEIPTVGITEEGEYEGYPAEAELPYRESETKYDEEQRRMLAELGIEEARRIRAEKGMPRGALSRKEQEKILEITRKRLYEDKPVDYLATESLPTYNKIREYITKDYPERLNSYPIDIDDKDMQILKDGYRTIYENLIRDKRKINEISQERIREQRRIEGIQKEERNRLLKEQQKEEKRRLHGEKMFRQEEAKRLRLERQRIAEERGREKAAKKIGEAFRRSRPAAAPAAPAEPAAAPEERKEGEGKPKRGRGRPKKTIASISILEVKKAGRPRKAIIKVVEPVVKKGRGRPKKSPLVAPLVAKKGRGRPRKLPSIASTEEPKLNRMKKKKV